MLADHLDDRDDVLARKVRDPHFFLAEEQCDDREGADDADNDQRQEYPDAFEEAVHD
jgi:hypothetical protein